MRLVKAKAKPLNPAEGASKKWPNFFIVGAAKAGTTSLHEYLKSVPGIYMSDYKEPHYFAPNVVPDKYYRKIQNKEEYVELFKNVKNETAIGESSVSYLWDKESPNLIKNASPNAKIIIILRNPIERAYSHYLHHSRVGYDTLDFYKAIYRDYQRKSRLWQIPDVYVDQGLYYHQVRRFLETFPPENIKILVFEEFIKDPIKVVKDLLKFLNVDAEIPPTVGKLHNPSYVPRSSLSPRIMRFLTMLGNKNNASFTLTHNIVPVDSTLKVLIPILWKRSSAKQKIPEEAYRFLYGIYKDDVKHLESLISRSLPWKF
jgi:hypothetical protein